MSSTIFFFLFIPFLAFILLAVNLIFAPHNPYMEKNNVFECGFSSFLGQNRTQFSISFFIFALLFLLFDLEILLVYPYLVSAYTNEVYGLAIMLMFLLALTLGFAFELGKKALYIDSRQMSRVATCKSNYLNKVKGNISLDVSTGYIGLHVNTGNKNNYSTSSYLVKTIKYKQYFISSKSSLLGKKWLSTLYMRGYSTGGSPSDSNYISKFLLISIPLSHKNLFLTGTQAVSSNIVNNVLVKALYSSVCVSKQVKFRLAFRVLDIPALHVQINDSAKHKLYFLDTVKNMAPHIPFHNEGIEFIFGPKVAEVLVLMIMSELLDQNKIPDDVHIQISYWALKDDYSNNSDQISYNIYRDHGLYINYNPDHDLYYNDDQDD